MYHCYCYYTYDIIVIFNAPYASSTYLTLLQPYDDTYVYT